ncbi:MAG: 3-deoxy-manno-octulosonate cytidylyltransferase, partial [Bacteroidetes bacterium]|nr:3-deoxy-manno-octulosonate cytidylyltransferase [Bacteroidota bacterium]
PQKTWLESHPFYKHLGIYAYRFDLLKKYSELEISQLEKSESLEQLRWLDNGYSIQIVETDLETIGVDTPEDLEKIKVLLAEG